MAAVLPLLIHVFISIPPTPHTSKMNKRKGNRKSSNDTNYALPTPFTGDGKE